VPTLGFITDIPGLGVSFVDDAERQAYAARPVAGVWPAHSPLLEAACDSDGLDDLLIIARGEESWLTDRTQADEVLGPWPAAGPSGWCSAMRKARRLCRVTCVMQPAVTGFPS
jgi:hypothetical protein